MEKNATVVRQNEKLPFKVKLAYGLSATTVLLHGRLLVIMDCTSLQM